jgi:hypothetical protein
MEFSEPVPASTQCRFSPDGKMLASVRRRAATRRGGEIVLGF